MIKMINTLEEYKIYVKDRLAPISDIMANIAAGDFSKKLEIPSTDDEFTELYVGLDFLMEDLEEHLKEREEAEVELKRYQATLEQKVKDRTAELSLINKQLRKEIQEHEEDKRVLEEMESKYSLLYENMSDVIFVFNSDLILTDITPSVEKMSGYKSEDLIGSSFDDLDFLTTESLKKAFNSAERLFQGEDIGYQEYEFVTKTGKTLFAEVNNTPVFENDDLKEFICVARDITERKEAEEALRESEEKYRNLVENISDVIYTLDKNGNITYLSTAVQGFIGYKPEELIGRSVFELIHEEDQYKIDKNSKEVLNGKNFETEYRIKTKDGAIRWMNTSSQPIYLNDEIIGVQGIVSDITERKKVEEQIKLSLKEKELHLREIHHRVKNNIQVISSMLSLYTNYIKDEQYAEMFNELKNRIHTMSLIHEKLYLAKDTKQINFRDYIQELVNNLFQFYEKTAKQINTNIEIQKISLGLDSAIPCGLIINELVSNVFKHAFKEGMTGEVKIYLKSELLNNGDNRITIIVADNGLGFPSEIDFKNTQTFGLLLVNTYVEQLGGTIELNTENGSEFKIVFNEHP